MTSEVLCIPVRKRKLYREEIGVQNPIVWWRWDCPVSGEKIRSADGTTASTMMLEHDCEGAGWCSIPATHPSQPSGLVPQLQATKEDRERWLLLGERRVRA